MRDYEHPLTPGGEKAIIIDVIPPGMNKREALERLEELERLIDTFGGVTILKIIQKRGRPSAKTYIGSGKAEEVVKLQKELGATMVVINGFMKANQFHNLTLMIDCEVMDRFELILKIFAKHARTEKARLQIRLAFLKYEFPRLFGKQAGHAQQRGGTGTVTRGKGEKLLELKREHLRDQIRAIEKKLESIQKVHSGQRQRRKRQGFLTVAIVGYTNSGKSTLLKQITHKKNAYTANKLFATLETKLGSLYIEDFPRTVLLADTIGFIQDLPPLLFESFITTLEEVTEADLVLHIIDAADLKIYEKIDTVEKILKDLECDKKPQLYVLNKMDMVKDKQKILKTYAYLNPVTISALQKEGFQELKTAIKNKFYEIF
ncbi:MAG: GTP-binding protein [uncultured bacterium]|nr:MAG: GTP-binding protein [uncultured bacterium]KKT02986.1 MAG: GTP-binding protein, GTP-binding protein HflX [Candidatus Peregrinibacteria bacterium GW2011_GWF2_43_17]HAU40330.1 GTPase HflX [Candidatus Peregrinibacteria bacterium]